MLEKTYTPNTIEQPIYDKWQKNNAFKARGETGKDTFVIMMPPPNVTGNLHMGHGLNYTLQDILVRYQRMRGKDTLWLPGTDHAGIATQSVVERQLEQEKFTRQDLGREKFLERVWQWKDQSGGAIVSQQKRLGVSADWSRERFTMDEGLNKAVREVFVRLYDEGLIYRDHRLVNWDPKLLTAVSDLEVETKVQKGHFWHIKYPLVDEADAFMVVATTRPETLFGDMAVAVHPDDSRYQKWIGRKVIVPLVNREVPIIADVHSDPEKGTGAVKITPAHDFDDFEVGKRHNLERLTIMDQHGHLTGEVPKDFQGLDRFKAREKVVDALEALHFLHKVEKKEILIPFGERSGAILEPRLTKQWFVDAQTLAKPALEAVQSGRTKFMPAHWEATYFEWLKTIQPWCISRQIWWGHQIPVWYGPDQEVFVALTEEEAQQKAHTHYGKTVSLTRDTDVLDTWFSSALWPFSTLGWPEETPDLKRYYPGDVLITGFDIIFFWVARMMMMGLHFMKEVPFKTVYINALVRDEKGQKMSKSKGNVVNPLTLMDDYGADALRFCMAALATPGVDIKFFKPQVEGYRNFCTKLWNSARYCEQKGCSLEPLFDPYSVKHSVNQWIIYKLLEKAQTLSSALENNRFDLAASTAYQFVWTQVCDWFIELSKPLLESDSEDQAEETRQTLAWVLAQILHLLHPFIPFLTEEIWQTLFHQNEMLITSSWPSFKELPASYEKAEGELSWFMELVTHMRTVRSQVNIPGRALIKLGVTGASAQTKTYLESYGLLLSKLARVSSVELLEGNNSEFQSQSVSLVHREATFFMYVGTIIDIEAEVGRLQKSIESAEKERASLSKKLSNQDFISRAPQEIISKNKTRLEESTQLRDALVKTLEKLKTTNRAD